jgi:shikimate dehydrogenase
VSSDSRPRLAGVIGWPVAHSLSPSLHGHWFEACGVRGRYTALAVRPGELALAFGMLPSLGFRGWNVTLPHKEAALRLIDECDRSAERTGSVNTVLVYADGRTRGYSTDGAGFLANLDAQAPEWREGKGPAVLLGTGGAARAVAVMLLDAGVGALRLVNRTRERADALAHDLRALFPRVVLEVLDWGDRDTSLAGAALCVNCTSLGMKGQPPLDLDLSALPLTSTVADLVYVPLETPLLAAARAWGHPVVDGLGMLIHQAVPGFRHWGGIEPRVDQAARDVLLQRLFPRV